LSRRTTDAAVAWNAIEARGTRAVELLAAVFRRAALRPHRAVNARLPSVRVAWRDVFIGALVTGLLFTMGKFVIGAYVGNSGLASTYGAAGSVVLLLVWVYYSAQIFLLGAEFTRSYAHQLGSLRCTRPHGWPRMPGPPSSHPQATPLTKITTQICILDEVAELVSTWRPNGIRRIGSCPSPRCMVPACEACLHRGSQQLRLKHLGEVLAVLECTLEQARLSWAVG
jgi:hypothetical protein